MPTERSDNPRNACDRCWILWVLDSTCQTHISPTVLSKFRIYAMSIMTSSPVPQAKTT